MIFTVDERGLSMRKLTVKNFSVIKDAELEFGKITVLIGPQSSGKSLLCKLAFFFSQVVPEIDYAMLPFGKSFDDFKITLLHEFTERFPRSTWSGQAFRVAYTSIQFKIVVSSDATEASLRIEFNGGFSERYDRHVQISSIPTERINAIDPWWIEERILVGSLRQEHSVYIPTGRAFFSTANKGFASFSGKNLDWITQRFSTEMDFDYRGLIETSDPSSDLLPQFLDVAAYILGGEVVREGGAILFQSKADGRKLPFQLLSSGTLELLPLLNPLASRVSVIATKPLLAGSTSNPIPGTIFVEEPESSVFPNTQYDLMRLFAWLSSEPRLNFHFAITTHSPYILSSLNNLLEAWQVVATKPEAKDEVAKLIDERYWIRPSDFKAYCIHDGKLESIMDEETGLINANYLDNVSETIGSEFDELLRLGYVEA
jgi:hypothetical protein